MKIAQEEISSQTATDREQALSTEQTVVNEPTETTPLHPKQLQQFLQQLNWQEQETTAGISLTLLAEELNRSWYGRLNHWFLREPLLFKILQWPFSKRWPAGSVLLTDNERLLKQIYSVNGYLEGTDLMLNKVWSSLLLSFLAVDIYNYYRHPNLRYGNTLLKVFLVQTDNQQMLSNVLTLPQAWPILLGTPVLWGILKAYLSARHARAVDKKTYRTLLETLGHYQASLWKDIGRWVLPSLLPEFVPNLALFALLPEPKLKLALESAERLLLWDRRISLEERRKLLEQVQVLAHKATYITQLKALTTLAKVADGIAPHDLVWLSQQGVDTENLKSLLWVKQQAKQTLKQVAQNPSTQLLPLAEMEPLINPPLMDDKLAIPSRSRYLYTHYLLWTLGQPHDYRLQPLFWSYLAFQGYFKARFFYLLGRGMYETFGYYWDKWQCERERRLWSYFNERAEWECSICGDFPIFYKDVFDPKTCWDTYVQNPRPVEALVRLINRLDFATISNIDLSALRLSGQNLTVVLDALKPKVNYLPAISFILNNTAPIDAMGAEAIAAFLKYAPVAGLTLFGEELTGNNTKAIASALPTTKVKVCNLGANKIGSTGAKEISQVLNQTQIESLYLSGNNIGDEESEYLAAGLLGSKVTVLDLSNNNIGIKGISLIGQILNQTNIQSLILNFNQITSEGAEALAKGLPQSQIRGLSLQSNNISTNGAIALAGVLPTTAIEYLNLNTNSIGDNGLQALGKVLNQTQILELYISYNNIGTQGAKGLGEGLRKSKLQTLSLGIGNNIGNEGLKFLAENMPESNITRLYLNSNNITSVCEAGSQILLSPIQVFVLSGNTIGDVGMACLVPYLSKSLLRALYLNECNIGPEGAEALGPALNTSNLEELGLSYNNLRVEGIKKISQGLRGSKIFYLNLDNGNINDASAAQIGQGLPGSKVQELRLNNNNIGAEGAKGLGQGLPDSNVQQLYLNNNNVGAEGAKGLGQGLPGSKVQELYLSNNSISAEGAEGLRQGLPGSKVQILNLDSNYLGDKGSIALTEILVKNTFNPNDLVNVLTPDAKKALARASANTPLRALNLGSNNITDKGAKALCRVLPATYIPIGDLQLAGNPIDPQQVDVQTCFVSSANALPSSPLVAFYQLCRTTLHYVIGRYPYMTINWLTTPMFPSLTDNAQDQFSSSHDLKTNVVVEHLPDPADFLPEEIIFHEPPTIQEPLSEVNAEKSVFTFEITPAYLTDDVATAVSKNNKGQLSKLWESEAVNSNSQPSKNAFSFFNTLTKTSSSVTTQSLNSSFSALPKQPAQTLSIVNTLSIAGAAVTGMLAAGYWVWRNFKRNNNAVLLSEKPANSQPDVKTFKLVF